MKPEFWDTRYDTVTFAYGINPNEYLISESIHADLTSWN